jgi:hypothetical protein
MDEQFESELLAIALHAHVTQRCRRAYVHDLRNSLQGIFAGIDVLTRMIAGKPSPSMSVDKVGQLVRTAFQRHEEALTRTVDDLAGQRETASAVDVTALFRQLIAFLGNDAATRDISMRSEIVEPLHALARPDKFRLIALAVLVRAIDRLPQGGEIAVNAKTQGETIAIQITLSSATAHLADDWNFDTPSYTTETWIPYAMRKVATADHGTIESMLGSSDRPTRIVCLAYRMANSPPDRRADSPVDTAAGSG